MACPIPDLSRSEPYAQDSPPKRDVCGLSFANNFTPFDRRSLLDAELIEIWPCPSLGRES
jgi:hypothetical protein